jgi:hypothetical protein
MSELTPSLPIQFYPNGMRSISVFRAFYDSSIWEDRNAVFTFSDPSTGESLIQTAFTGAFNTATFNIPARFTDLSISAGGGLSASHSHTFSERYTLVLLSYNDTIISDGGEDIPVEGSTRIAIREIDYSHIGGLLNFNGGAASVKLRINSGSDTTVTPGSWSDALDLDTESLDRNPLPDSSSVLAYFGQADQTVGRAIRNMDDVLRLSNRFARIPGGLVVEAIQTYVNASDVESAHSSRVSFSFISASGGTLNWSTSNTYQWSYFSPYLDATL